MDAVDMVSLPNQAGGLYTRPNGLCARMRSRSVVYPFCPFFLAIMFSCYKHALRTDGAPERVLLGTRFSNHVRRICFLFPPLTVLFCHENTLLTDCASEEMLFRTFSQTVTKHFFSNCLGQSEKKRS